MTSLLSVEKVNKRKRYFTVTTSKSGVITIKRA